LLERDLQDYLFNHPEVVLPDEPILEKSREFCIEGKRIDLLFRTALRRYIIELKAVSLTREHVGQVIEYYGLLRSRLKDGDLKMVLVAPSILSSRRTFLEELGIRCVVISSTPVTDSQVQRLKREAIAQQKQETIEQELAECVRDLDSIRYQSFVTEVDRESLAISHRLLRDSLADVRDIFSPYEVRPVKMVRADSPDRICEAIPQEMGPAPFFRRGGAWWAYAFGESEDMPKNDLPNISAMAMPWGFDLAINAELQRSQVVMRNRIEEKPETFDDLLRKHNGLQFQALLKIEHQPRFYHWIPLVFRQPAEWNAKTLLEAVNGILGEYPTMRDRWIARIEADGAGLSGRQASHMRSVNQKPNIALRMVRPFGRNDPFWSLPYSDQCSLFIAECSRLKPFIDFFR